MKAFLSIFFILLPHLSLGCDYCAFGEDNTMCQYQPDACPDTVYAKGTTQTDIDAIVKTHNDLRSTVASGSQPDQPPAANMEEMKWDSELAEMAQRWADQCTFGHDSNRRTCEFSSVGQNAFMVMYGGIVDSTADFPGAINAWYNEVDKFNSSYIDPFVWNDEAGHYTQVVWATSNRVGCGYLHYGDSNKYYICNYGPAGNVIGGSMYKIGNPATLCPNGVSTTYPALCSS